MNKSEPVAQRTTEAPPITREQLKALHSLLVEQVATDFGEPDHDEQKQDVYLLLHPDVRRLLVQLGRTENKELLRLLLKADAEDLADVRGMLHDYREAKKLGKTIRAIALGLGGFLTMLVGIVKGAPDVLDWLRGLLPK